MRLRPGHHWGEFTALPRFPSWFQGAASRQGREGGKERGGRSGKEGKVKGREEEGSVPPLLFFTIVTL